MKILFAGFYVGLPWKSWKCLNKEKVLQGLEIVLNNTSDLLLPWTVLEFRFGGSFKSPPIGKICENILILGLIMRLKSSIGNYSYYIFWGEWIIFHFCKLNMKIWHKSVTSFLHDCYFRVCFCWLKHCYYLLRIVRRFKRDRYVCI